MLSRYSNTEEQIVHYTNIVCLSSVYAMCVLIACVYIGSLVSVPYLVYGMQKYLLRFLTAVNFVICNYLYSIQYVRHVVVVYMVLYCLTLLSIPRLVVMRLVEIFGISVAMHLMLIRLIISLVELKSFGFSKLSLMLYLCQLASVVAVFLSFMTFRVSSSNGYGMFWQFIMFLFYSLQAAILNSLIGTMIASYGQYTNTCNQLIVASVSSILTPSLMLALGYFYYC